MRRNTWIAAIAAAFLSTAALAQMGGPGPFGPGSGSGYGPGMGAMMGGGYGAGGCGMRAEVMDALGLTAEQRASIATILDETSAQRLALMESMHQLRSQALRSGTPDYTAMAAARERMRTAALDSRQRIDAVLTPEQRARLNSGWRGFGR